jgi:hypothetical protein
MSKHTRFWKLHLIYAPLLALLIALSGYFSAPSVNNAMAALVQSPPPATLASTQTITPTSPSSPTPTPTPTTAKLPDFLLPFCGHNLEGFVLYDLLCTPIVDVTYRGCCYLVFEEDDGEWLIYPSNQPGEKWIAKPDSAGEWALTRLADGATWTIKPDTEAAGGWVIKSAVDGTVLRTKDFGPKTIPGLFLQPDPANRQRLELGQTPEVPPVWIRQPAPGTSGEEKFMPLAGKSGEWSIETDKTIPQKWLVVPDTKNPRRWIFTPDLQDLQNVNIPQDMNALQQWHFEPDPAAPFSWSFEPASEH